MQKHAHLRVCAYEGVWGPPRKNLNLDALRLLLGQDCCLHHTQFQDSEGWGGDSPPYETLTNNYRLQNWHDKGYVMSGCEDACVSGKACLYLASVDLLISSCFSCNSVCWCVRWRDWREQ